MKYGGTRTGGGGDMIWMLNKQDLRNMDRIHLALDRAQGRDLMNMVINHQLP
jgi:hypothetical protein